MSSNDPTPQNTKHKKDAAGRHLVSWLILLIPALGGIYLDLWSKSWAFPNGVIPGLTEQGRHPYPPADWLIPGILQFITTTNHGAVFGTMQGMSYLFIPFSFLALIAVIIAFYFSHQKQWIIHFALGLILAGAVGNLYDRLILNSVRDFMRFPLSWFPYIFNVADVALCIGVPLLALCWSVAPSEKNDPNAPTPPSPGK